MIYVLQNLAVGMRVWGSVLEVSQRGLTVGLPHGLRGRVSPAEVQIRTGELIAAFWISSLL